LFILLLILLCFFVFFFLFIFFFFFSSRRRHTRFSRDWSSDVCSSDLYLEFSCLFFIPNLRDGLDESRIRDFQRSPKKFYNQESRSEERRVGKECRSRWAPDY